MALNPMAGGLGSVRSVSGVVEHVGGIARPAKFSLILAFTASVILTTDWILSEFSSRL